MPLQPVEKIWMDGKLIDWREANVHILTHAMHYASSVFEGERAYNGKIFLSRKHSERLHFSASELDFQISWTVDEIEAAKQEVLTINGARCANELHICADVQVTDIFTTIAA